MATEVNLRRILDRKQWEMCAFAPANSAAAAFIAGGSPVDQIQYYVLSGTVMYAYDPAEDGWMQLQSPALATFVAGACGIRHPHGPRATATGGTTTTIVTNLNLQRGLKGYKVRIIAGPNAGTEATIKSNTTGTNSVITVETPFGVAITAASEYILLTGRIWMLGGGTLAAGSFRYYDIATNVTTTANYTGLPAAIGTDARMTATAASTLAPFATGTATSATTTTLVNSAKTWSVNNWANYQVRITAGTGAGQFRAIASNTATTLTVSAAWTITPDATSQYAIEGNDDSIYLTGNAAITLYRYSISGNTWTTLTPTVARAGAAGLGHSAHWVTSVTSADWTDESNYQNGEFIYSFRGGASAILDRYNIALNTWENDIAYSPKFDTFTTGTSWNYSGDFIYSINQLGRLLKYNIAEQRQEPCSQLFYTQGAALLGDRMFDATYTDGATTLRWLYFVSNTQNVMFRILLF